MKIFAANYVERNVYSGSSGHLIQWAEAMEKRGHHVDLLFGDDVVKGLGPLNKISRPPHIFWVFPLKVLCRLMQEKESYDVIQITDVDGMLAWPVCRLLGRHRQAKFVLKMQGVMKRHLDALIEESKRGHGHVSLKHKLWLQLTRFFPMKIVKMFTDVVVAASRADLKIMTHYFGFHEQQLAYLPQGIHEIYLNSSILKRESKNILFVGGWYPAKGIYDLRDALESMVDLDWTCVLAGTGKSAEDILPMFTESLRKRIDVKARCNREELLALYQKANCLVLPTLSDVLPSVALEAAACGCSVIATKDFGFLDVFDEEALATLIPARQPKELAEAMTQHLQSPPNEEFLLKVSKHVNKLTWSEMACRFEHIIEQIHEK